MINLSADILHEPNAVHIQVKGVNPVCEIETLMLIHTLIQGYSECRGISYDAGKLKLMCKLAKIESIYEGSGKSEDSDDKIQD